MKTAPSNLFAISMADFRMGYCDICKQAAILRYRDASTGARLGNCCLHEAITSDRYLSKAEGLRHPTIIEADALPNN